MSLTVGGNLLNQAMSIIGGQTVVYHRFVARDTTVAGQLVARYAPALTLRGNMQPVPRKLVQQYGLDLQSKYFTFYTLAALLDVDRDISGDQVVFDGRRMQVLSLNDWFPMNGWVGVLCVQIGELPTGYNDYAG